MANIFDEKERRVIPNWRSFNTTVALGELQSVSKSPLSPNLNIDLYIAEWQKNKNLFIAAELLSAAYINNIKSHRETHEAATYILRNKNSTKNQISLANLIINNVDDYSIKNKYDLDLLLNKITIYQKIHKIKKQLISFPKNPLLLVDLSRLYMIIGEVEKSKDLMLQAIYLAPNNRFILRSMARQFIRFDIKYAHKVLLNSLNVSHDPWLTSAEISLSTILGKRSSLIKQGLSILASDIDPFNYTELASSLATVEFYHGSIRKSTRLFEKSLIAPNDNSLAQIEWIMDKSKLLNFIVPSKNVKNNFEALAIAHFRNGNWKKAVEYSTKWFLDMPYTKRSVLLTSYILSSLVEKHIEAVKILKAGLISHPNNPNLLNNLAYSHALMNDVVNANHYLNQVKDVNSLRLPDKICLIATKGLIKFREGNVNQGRMYYLDSIEEARKHSYNRLYILAFSNYVREEIRSKIPIAQQQILKSKLKDISKNNTDSDITAIVKKII